MRRFGEVDMAIRNLSYRVIQSRDIVHQLQNTQFSLVNINKKKRSVHHRICALRSAPLCCACLSSLFFVFFFVLENPSCLCPKYIRICAMFFVCMPDVCTYICMYYVLHVSMYARTNVRGCGPCIFMYMW